MLKQFENCISLGESCSLSMFMCRTGLHSFTGPFDWIDTLSFDGVLKNIDNGFVDFLNEKNLQREGFYNYTVYDKKYNIYFFHDFCKKYEEVKEKFDIKAKRLLEKMKQPSCFFRLVSNKMEVAYINNNQKYIQKVIKKYNNDNEIVFLICKKSIGEKIEIGKSFYLNVEEPYELCWFQHKDHSYKILENKEICKFIKDILPTEIVEKNKKFYYNGYNSKFGPFIEI